MTTNATVEARHKDGAAGIALMSPGHLRDWIAQTLANLEAARAENADLNNRLAEIDRIAHSEAWTVDAKIVRIRAALASGHTPSPCPSCNGLNISCPEGCERDPLTGELIPWACPGCAAKDEAMEAGQFLLDRLDALEWLDGQLEDTARDYMGHVEPAIERFRATLSRFIIPPADPVAEALKAAIHAYGGELIEGENFDMAVAELKSRLPLGGAK